MTAQRFGLFVRRERPQPQHRTMTGALCDMLAVERDPRGGGGLKVTTFSSVTARWTSRRADAVSPRAGVPRRIRCWIAPRVPGGRARLRPADHLGDRIETAQVMVLIFSDNVNNSTGGAERDQHRRGHANVTIVPFRLAKVDFNPELHFYLGRMHWLDAFPPPIDAHIDTLERDDPAQFLKPVAGEATTPPAPPPPAPPPPPPIGVAPTHPSAQAPGQHPRRRRHAHDDRRRHPGRAAAGPADRRRLAAGAETRPRRRRPIR